MRLPALLLMWALSCPSQAGRLCLDVPYVEQVKAGCGSAAISMVIQYWAAQYPEFQNAAADTERIDKLLPAKSRQGIRGEALKAYLEKAGFEAFLFDGEISDLRHHLAKGRPIVVCLAPKGPNAPLHYAVVAGMDDSMIWLNDSARGKLFSEDLATFSREWQATGSWALLAVPRLHQ